VRDQGNRNVLLQIDADRQRNLIRAPNKSSRISLPHESHSERFMISLSSPSQLDGNRRNLFFFPTAHPHLISFLSVKDDLGTYTIPGSICQALDQRNFS
jgi:hypothetical protein